MGRKAVWRRQARPVRAISPKPSGRHFSPIGAPAGPQGRRGLKTRRRAEGQGRQFPRPNQVTTKSHFLLGLPSLKWPPFRSRPEEATARHKQRHSSRRERSTSTPSRAPRKRESHCRGGCWSHSRNMSEVRGSVEGTVRVDWGGGGALPRVTQCSRAAAARGGALLCGSVRIQRCLRSTNAERC